MSYDDVKELNGRYTGMKVGRSHRWRYDAGEWKERKVTPDRWEFTYSVVKRRAGRAPEGSGAPVGTAYRWFIVANQVVTKLDANSYTTEMVGHKLEVAHRRADHASWNASERAKNKQLVKPLRELADDLEAATGETEAQQPAPAAPPRRHAVPPRKPRARPVAHRSAAPRRPAARSHHRWRSHFFTKQLA